MTTIAIRLALAELNGFVWYRTRGTHPTDWGMVCLHFPSEEGIAAPTWVGTVSETRLCTAEEIATAKATLTFATYAPDYLNDLNAAVPLLERYSPTIELLDHSGPGRWNVKLNVKDNAVGERLFWRPGESGYGETLCEAICMAILKQNGRWID